MDYSNKLLVGLATAPTILVSMLLLAQFGLVGYLLACSIFVAITVLYNVVVVATEQPKKLGRFVLFIAIPLAFFVGAMYV
ncbi:hypothetical protein Q4561_11715 [Alteromonas sp. 1_MG-2023]|uniref:hypothetical protein n=1 Tax=Alteromonas sp. 1_MG-2023 TaxID=3062669 RepID=UPI0026E114BF|nr:hypothetical protein [Alteromonas sp. 1_MG-2023]MDO6567727.1 hypothetical protein [Alteromonas sp. 1_MG-2023]